MRKAIFTIMLGPNPIFHYAKYALAAYADRIGAELIIMTKPVYQRPSDMIFDIFEIATLQKRFVVEILKNFDRVLYVDADVLVTPHAPDVFEAYPDPSAIFMFDEGQYVDRTGEIDAIVRAFGLDGEWPRPDSRPPIYYNAGIMLCSRNHHPFDAYSGDDIARLYGVLKMVDQTYINYLINRNGIDVRPLRPLYNRMEILGGYERRLEGYFIHYAGTGYSPRKKYRYRTFANDFRTLYGVRNPFIDELRLRCDYLFHELWRFKNDTLRDASKKIAARSSAHRDL